MPICHRLPFAVSAIPAARTCSHLALPAIVLVAGVSLFAGRSARAANTQYNVKNAQTDLTATATYTTGGTSGTGVGGTAATTGPTITSDVTFNSGVAYSPAAFTLNSSQSFGSLNDLSTTALTIANTSPTGTGDTLTLGGAGNLGDGVVGSNAADLLFVGTGANLTVTGGTGVTALGLVLGQSGNFDVAGTAAISSIISDGGSNFGFTKTGAGTLTLSGINTNGGLNQINAGQITLTGATTKFGNGGVTIQAGTLLDSSANTAALGTGTLSLGTALSGASAATFNYNSGSTITLANAINAAAGATGALTVETTSGGLTLSGLITLNNNLNVVNTNSAGGNSLNLTGGVTGTGNLAFAASNAGGFILGPGGTVNFTGILSNVSTGGAGFGISANLTGAETLLQNSATSTTNVSGTNTYTGGTTINLGVLEFTKTAAMPTSGTATLNTTVNGGGTLGVAVGGAGQFTATGTGAGTLAGIFAGAGTGTSTVTLNPGSFVGVDTGSATVTYATPITNSGVGLNKLGANSLILTAAETYTGPTTITAGTLQLGNTTAGNNGSLASPSILDNATLLFAPATGTTIASSANISGSGVLTVNGAGGTANLAGVGTFTGATTVTAGTLDLQNSLALGNSTLTAPTAGSLIFDSAVTSNAFTVGGLTGSNNIVLQNNATTPAGITLTVGNVNNLSNTYSGVLSGPGGLSTFGFNNTLTLTGANTYTGTTTVGSGTLNLGGAGANGSIGSGGAGGALVLGGTGGGTLAYTRTGTNTQTFTGTTVNAGQNAITESLATQTIGLGTITNNAGGTLDVSSVGTVTTSNTANTNGILGGYATYGNRSTFAVAPATSGGAITGLNTYTTSATAGTAPANFLNQNIDVTAATTPTGAITPNSLRFNTATALTVTLPAGSVNTIVSGGILNTPTATATSVVTGGFLTSGSNQLSLISPVGGLTISSQIVDNGTTPLSVAATGPAGTTLATSFQNANNSFSGGAYLNGGRFGFASGGTAFGTGTLTFGDQVTSGNNGGGLLIAGQSFTTGLLAMPRGDNTSNGDIGANNGLNVITLQGTGTATFNGTFGSLAAGNGGRETTVVLNSGTEIFGALSNVGTFNGIGRGSTGVAGGFVVNGGTFQLGNGFSGTVADEGTSVTLGGGTFAEVGNVAGFYNQTFTGGIIVNPGASAVTVNSNGGAGTVFSPGAITRTVGGGTVNFTLPTAQGGAQNAVNGITTTTLNTNGIIGGYATVGGTDWATNATNTSGGNIIGLSNSTSNAYSTNTFGAGLNTDVTTSGIGASTNSLRFNTAGANTVTFNGSNAIASGGILVTPNVGSGNATTITGGTITGSAQDLVVIQNNTGVNGALTISSTIGANGTSGLTKSGAGVLILAPDPNAGGPNFFTGALTINGGTVNLNQDGLGLASSIVLNGGTFQANGAVNGQTQAATPANIGVVMGINGGTIDTTGGNVTLPGNVTNAAGNQFAGAGAFGGFNSTGVGALTVTGGGTVALGGAANAFGGGIVINNGIVQDASSSAASTTTLGTGYLTFGNNANPATVDLNGHNATVAGLIGAGTNGVVTNNSAAASASALTLNGVSTQTFSGRIQDGTTGTMAITLALNNPLAAQILTGVNTYSGGTLVNAGTLLVNNTTGSGTGTGAVTIGNGTTLMGRLGGTGTIGGATTVNAGSAITGGTFGTVGMLTVTSTLILNGTYVADLGTLGASDRLVLSATGANGILAFGSNAGITFTGTPDANTYILATYASDTGFGSLLANSSLPTGYSLLDTGTMLELTAVPEPSTALLSGLGAIALFVFGRRKMLRRNIS